MKKITCTLLSVVFLSLGSCSTKDEVIKPAEVSNINALPAETVGYLPFMTSYDLKRKNASNGSARINGWQEFGPFTVPSTVTKVQSNVKLFLNSRPLFAGGIYFVDVYRCSATVTLDAGALMNFTGSSKTGFLSPSNQTSGVGVIQTGNTYEFVTYSIIPRTTLLGQAINAGTLPTDLTGTTFTYSYLKNI